jgi:ribosomal protein S18 acetylase RimI-like enzyme
MEINSVDSKIQIEPIDLTKDLQELTSVMKRAFDDDAIRFNNQPEGGGPPGYDTGEFYQKWVPKGNGFKLVYRGKIVGAIIIFVTQTGPSYIGNINIDPDFQNLGFGKKLIQFSEAKYPQVKHWQLETPQWATRNHHFYEKNGYSKFKEVVYEDGFKTYVFQKFR